MTITGDAPQVEWYKGYGTDREEHVHEGIETSDGGFLAIGHNSESSGETTDILLIKVSGSGQEEWQTLIGSAGGWDVGLAVLEVADGYLAAGGLSVNGVQRSGLIKLDFQGAELWRETYHSNGNAGIRGLDHSANGNVVATGYQGAPDSGFVFIADEGSGFLMEVDSSGAKRWEQDLDFNQGTKVRHTSDGGFAVLAMSWLDIGEEAVENPSLLKTDAAGEEEWRQNYGGSESNQAFDFDLNEDGSFILAGHSPAFGAANWDCVLTKVSASGEQEWIRHFGQPRGYDAKFVHDECYGVRQDTDGGFVMVGGTGDEYAYSAEGHPSGPSDEWKAYAIKVDTNGDVVWEQVYDDGPDRGHNAAEFLSLTSDGGYLLFNDTDSTGSPAPNNFGFMKLGGTAP